MKSNRTNKWMWFALALVAACLFLPAVSNAQGVPSDTRRTATDNTLTEADSVRAGQQLEDKYLGQTLGDPKEEAAYQAFHKAGEPAKKVKLGNAFLAKYPGDHYTEAVYEELTQTFYDTKDLTSFYSYSDKGLSLFPDDVHLLALSGWVIPRAFSADDPDGDKKLDKAESQSKHALDVIGSMPKPPAFTDQQFTDFKTGETAVAHSGLGLIYFRREKYDESAKQLEVALKGETTPDPSDFFVLGADYENMGKFKEAADAFTHCAQIAGSMQDQCKQLANAAQKEASGAK